MVWRLSTMTAPPMAPAAAAVAPLTKALIWGWSRWRMNHRPGNGDAEVDGNQDGGGGDERAGQARGEIADEGGGDDDRPWGDQAHRDRVDELAAGEPVVLGDDSCAQERDDGQAAAEDERPGL